MQSIRIWSAAALAATLLFAAGATGGETITGRASVIDGDTIDIAGSRIRFNGIDAPESWQTCRDGAGAEYRCGKVSAEKLDQFLAGSRPTRCALMSLDRYGRHVADCYRADGQSVAVFMVGSGYALDWPRYSHGAYAAEQEVARKGRAGMWQGAFQEPWKARQR